MAKTTITSARKARRIANTVINKNQNQSRMDIINGNDIIHLYFDEKGNQIKSKNGKMCNYCRNHGVKSAEKGHREVCLYKNCKCVPCKKTRQKTVNAQNCRKRKKEAKTEKVGVTSTGMQTDDNLFYIDIPDINSNEFDDVFRYVNIDGNSDPMDITDDDIIIDESCATDQSESSADESVENPFKVALLPTGYPKKIYTVEQGEEIEKLLAHEMATIPTGAYEPRIQYRFLENGRYLIACFDQMSFDWVMEKAKLWNVYDNTVIAVAEDKIPKYIDMTCIIDNPIADAEFLTGISNSNPLNASRWKFYEARLAGDGKFVVTFGVDPISYCMMNAINFCFKIGSKHVKARIVKKNYGFN